MTITLTPDTLALTFGAPAPTVVNGIRLTPDTVVLVLQPAPDIGPSFSFRVRQLRDATPEAVAAATWRWFAG
jgi:hypothetical protein